MYKTYKIEKEFFPAFTRIHKKNNTLAMQEVYKEFTYHTSWRVLFDVFPLDKVPDNTLLRNLEFFALFSIENLKALKNKVRAFRSRNIFLKSIKIFFYYLLYPVPFYFFNYIKDQVVRFFSFESSECYTLLYSSELSTCYDYCLPSGLYSELTTVEFEGHLFYAPKDYDLLLKSVFGSYMEYPAEEERTGAHGFISINLDQGSVRKNLT